MSELIGEHVHDAEVAIAIAALNFLGNYGMAIIIIGALLSTASALNATLLGSSRLTYMMAKDGIIPNSLSKISKSKVPYISIIIIGILSTTLTIVTGGALAIAGVAGLIFAQIFLIINFTNFKVRKQTNSKVIYPLIGMIFTFSFFLILIIYNIINIKKEIFSLLSFLLIEGYSLFFVIHINHKNSLKKL